MGFTFTMGYSIISKYILYIARRVPIVEQELPTLPEHLSSPSVCSGVRVTQSLVLCVCFLDRCLSFYPFSFGHCVVCSSSIYGFCLPLSYLQTLLYFFPLKVHFCYYYYNAEFDCVLSFMFRMRCYVLSILLFSHSGPVFL